METTQRLYLDNTIWLFTIYLIYEYVYIKIRINRGVGARGFHWAIIGYLANDAELTFTRTRLLTEILIEAVLCSLHQWIVIKRLPKLLTFWVVLNNMIIRCYRLNARPCFLFLSFFFFFFLGGGYQRIRKQVYVLWICIIYNNYGYPLLHCG